MSKKSFYILFGSATFLIIVLLVLSKKVWLGNRKIGKEVEIATVEQMNLIETVSATGKVRPETEIRISSEVSGEIIKLEISEGQSVKKGDLLVCINPDLYLSGLKRSIAGLSNSKANLKQSEAQLKEATANYNRNKTLFDKEIISKSEWDKVVSAYEVALATKEAASFGVESALATVNEAKNNLKRTAIYAPIDGCISKLNVKLGERVVGTQQMTGTELLCLADFHKMEVEVEVNENNIIKLEMGNETIIEIDAYLKKQFKGIVTGISNAASVNLKPDQITHFKVKVSILKNSYLDLIQNKKEDSFPFRPGMTAVVDIITQKRENVIVAPISAIIVKSDTTRTKETTEVKQDQKKEYVFVKEGNRAKLKVVKTGIQDDKNIEIIEGLKKGDLVLAGPYNTIYKELNDNDLIFVKK